METMPRGYLTARLLLFWGLIIMLLLQQPVPLSAQGDSVLYVPLVAKHERLNLLGKILFTSLRDGNYEIYAMDANGANPVNLTQHPGLDSMARWSPDGRQIAFVSKRHDATGGAEVYIMNADGSDVRRLTHSDIASMTPNWSPDGKRIVFAQVVEVADPQDQFPLLTEVYSIKLDGSDLVRHTFTGPPYYRYHIFLANPSWSPDGRQLLVTMNLPPVDERLPGITRIGIQSAGERQPTPIFEDPFTITTDPVWSPDGSRIAYAYNDEIAVATVATKEDKQITHFFECEYFPIDDGADIGMECQHWNSSPTWAPDGTHIAFTSVANDQSDIYVVGVDVEDSQPVQLTTHPSADFDPDWQ